ncbi:MAG: hypothetical protein IPG44_10085 [Anaerolineales bacterium]|nr:hypothetical protein [Anaerolineales bacterium]
MFGKTEAWHVLEAELNAELVAGIKPNVSAEQLTAAIQSKSESILSWWKVKVTAGDTCSCIRAPSMHWDRMFDLRNSTDIRYHLSRL